MKIVQLFCGLLSETMQYHKVNLYKVLTCYRATGVLEKSVTVLTGHLQMNLSVIVGRQSPVKKVTIYPETPATFMTVVDPLKLLDQQIIHSKTYPAITVYKQSKAVLCLMQKLTC